MAGDATRLLKEAGVATRLLKEAGNAIRQEQAHRDEQRAQVKVQTISAARKVQAADATEGWATAPRTGHHPVDVEPEAAAKCWPRLTA